MKWQRTEERGTHNLASVASLGLDGSLVSLGRWKERSDGETRRQTKRELI